MEDEEWRPRARVPYRESSVLRIVAALLVVVGAFVTFRGLFVSNAWVAGPGYHLDPASVLVHTSERQLNLLGGLATIGLGILVKMLAILQAYVAHKRRGD